MDKRGCFTRNKSQWIKAGLKFKWVLQWSKISRYCQSQSPNLSQEYWNLFQGQPQLREQQPGEQQHREQQLREQQHWEQQPREKQLGEQQQQAGEKQLREQQHREQQQPGEKQLGEQQQLGEQYQSEEKQLWRNQNGRNLQLTFLSSTALSLELWKMLGVNVNQIQSVCLQKIVNIIKIKKIW